MYNTTGIINATSTGGLVETANQATGGVLIGSFTVALFFIMLIITKRNTDFINSLLVSSFICFVISTVLLYGGFISLYYVLAYLGVLAFTGLFSYVKQD